MKFAVVVVLVALALGANSSVLPIGLHHGAITINNSPLAHHLVAHGAVHDIHGLHGVHGAVHDIHGLHSVHGAVHDIHGLHSIHGAVHDIHGLHGVHGIHSPVQIVAGHHAVVTAAHHAGATAVSKTRGALHVAPLPGHIHSVVQANVHPAPGTL